MTGLGIALIEVKEKGIITQKKAVDIPVMLVNFNWRELMIGLFFSGLVIIALISIAENTSKGKLPASC